MKFYFTSTFCFLLLLVSCGGSKSDLNDSSLSGNAQNSNINQGNNPSQGNNTSNQTPSYSFEMS